MEWHNYALKFSYSLKTNIKKKISHFLTTLQSNSKKAGDFFHILRSSPNIWILFHFYGNAANVRIIPPWCYHFVNSEVQPPQLVFHFFSWHNYLENQVHSSNQKVLWGTHLDSRCTYLLTSFRNLWQCWISHILSAHFTLAKQYKRKNTIALFKVKILWESHKIWTKERTQWRCLKFQYSKKAPKF